MEKISTNCYKGKLITNPTDLMRLAKEKKSVWCANVWGLRPAAVLLNFPLIVILRAINNKSLYSVINSNK